MKKGMKAIPSKTDEIKTTNQKSRVDAACFSNKEQTSHQLPPQFLCIFLGGRNQGDY